jgi:hypothetical protein
MVSQSRIFSVAEFFAILLTYMLNNTRTYLLDFFFALLYGLSFYALMWFLFQRDMIDILPNAQTLQHWDVGWFISLRDKGYEYFEGYASNSAFYFLFPYIWRWTHLDELGISLLNIVFFSIGFCFFCGVYKMKSGEKLLLLTVPSICIAFIPYTEALFFLLSSWVMLAVTRKHISTIWLSLILLSFVRPVSMVLCIAFLITEIVNHRPGELLKALKSFFRQYGLPLLIGQTIFICYQYIETGVWFAFFKQEKNWGHVFAIPTLPFDSYNGPKFLWLNALSMFCGFIALLWMVSIGIKWLRNKTNEIPQLVVVSFLYILGISLIAALFNPRWDTGKTNVVDAHRYIMATPFFLVFINHFTASTKHYTWKSFAGIILLANIFWLLFGSYNHIRYLLYFNFSTVIVCLYMLYSYRNFTWVPMVLTAINLMVQVYLFTFYLHGGPIG